MRYMKGSMVEVLNLMDPLSESWRTAKIIAGNGHTYRVMYDSLDTGVTLEKVPRKALRPCPPPVNDPRSWVPGDIVEVSEGNSWKPAQVLRVAGDNSFVRILGHSREFLAHASKLRVRQIWQYGRWIVTGKVPNKGNGRFIESRSKLGNYQLPDVIDDGFEEHYQVSSRSTRKRRHFSSALAETCDRSGKKMRAVGEKEGREQRVTSKHPHLLKKVAAVASPHTMLGEKYMHASLDHKATIFSKLDMDRRKLNAQPNDAESICSSVGSCSVRNSAYRLPHHPITTLALDSNDDDESSCVVGRKQSFPELGPCEDIHQLELYAYRSTMLAFHASGPLTWEKEELLTNLRLDLHISNDEHLSELRRLASPSSNAHHSHSLVEAIPNSL